jgi:cephalosporin hydroxylase
VFDLKDFENNRRQRAELMANNTNLCKQAFDFVLAGFAHGYLHQWSWLGLPMLQLPSDMITLQEIVWETKPDIIIETGIAWGGSAVFYASLCQLLGKGVVVAVDLNLMDHVRAQIMAFPFSHRIHLYKGSSTDQAVAAAVKSHVTPGRTVMVVLDSNHAHEHVLAELNLYAPLVTKGNFLIVCDTWIEHSPPEAHKNRAWGPGNNSQTALLSYLKTTDRFDQDPYYNAKGVMSLMPNGFLRCVK